MEDKAGMDMAKNILENILRLYIFCNPKLVLVSVNPIDKFAVIYKEGI